MISQLFIVGNNEYAALVAKFVLVSALLDHCPGQPSVGGKEGIAVLYSYKSAGPQLIGRRDLP